MPNSNELHALRQTYVLATEYGASAMAEWAKGAQEFIESIAAGLDQVSVGVDHIVVRAKAKAKAVALDEIVQRSRALSAAGMNREAAMVLGLSPTEAASQWPGVGAPEWLAGLARSGTFTEAPIVEAPASLLAMSIAARMGGADKLYRESLKRSVPLLLAFTGAGSLVTAVQAGQTLYEAAESLPDDPIAQALVVRGRWLIIGLAVAVGLYVAMQLRGGGR